MLLPFLCLHICIIIYYQFNIINAETKEELFNGDSYAFTGLLKYESVPVLFPKDICMFTIEDKKFAACLHLNGERKQNFVIFKYTGNEYIKIHENSAPFALSMDCGSIGDKGYVVVAYNFTEDVKEINNGSPVYQIFQNEVSPVQYFTTTNLSSVQLRANGEELFLFQTITSIDDKCPIYTWKGFHFNIIDYIPCNNAKKMEPFQIESNTFMAVANFADESGTSETFSEIYKFDHDIRQYVLIQKIKTFAAIDVKYFNLEEEERDQHFLVFVNSIKVSNASTSETSAVIYKYENGRFVPFQKLRMHAVQQILPVKGGVGKFVMLVSSYNQPTILLEYIGQKFVKSNVQLTDGALGKGVSMMRVFEDYNETYIVIANENMLVNETNIYQPIYKKREGVNDKKKEILDWSEQAHKNLSQYNINDLRSRLKNFEQFRENLTTKENRLNSNYANIKEVVTKLLTYPPKKISSSYWHMIALTKRALNKIEEKLTKLEVIIPKLADPLVSETDHNPNTVESRNQLKIEDKINTNSMLVGTLIVRDKLLAEKVNNQSRTNIKLNNFNSKAIILRGKLITPDANETQDLGSSNTNRHSNDVFTAEDLAVSGNINGINLGVIQEFAIRKRGNQKIDASILVKSLSTNEVVTEGLLNGVNVSQVIDTNKGSYVINQELEFIKPIQANKVEVSERLNNIHVSQGKLDILLTKSQEEQVITGQKRFENVQIIEPITITGKIIGPAFEKISPITSINDGVILHGDYEIAGRVLVNNLLSSENIFGSSRQNSLLKVLETGLKKNASEISSNFKFIHPIYTNDAIMSSANGQNLENLIRTNTETVQMIHGHKLFQNDLTVKGLSEAGTINGIKVENLEKFTLQTVGDQYITGAMHFQNILVARISSQKIKLGENNIENILTKSTNQNIFGSVKIGKLYSSFADIKELKTAYDVMNIDFKELVKDTVHLDDVLSLNGETNFLANMHAQYLTIKKTVNLQPIEKIENFLTDVKGDTTFDGNTVFTGKLSVHNLTFVDSFNTIPNEEFGKCWLLNELNQQFTAPQTTAIMTTDDDLIMSGTINDFTLEDLLNNTYKINEVENINTVTFENDVVLQAPLTTSGKINNINFTAAVLLSKTQLPQQVSVPIIVKENVQVEGYINKPLKINNLDLNLLHSFAEGNQSEITLDHAIFENAPVIEKLNSYDLKELRENIWLVNEDTILESPFRFIETHFNNDVFKGYINGIDIKSLAENCFSLSKVQVISTPLAFNQIVKFGSVLKTPKMTLHGHLKDIRRELTIDFDHFVTNTLTKFGGQEIEGQWNIEQVVVHGNVDNVLINDLRLPNDVVTFGKETINITAPKRIESAIIGDLLCEPRSTVNGVNLLDWLERSVLLQGNYTIQGTTTIDESFFYNGITAYGSVNNITFDAANLLLKSKDQIIQGDVYVVTKYLKRLQISPLTFAHLYAEYVNDLNMIQFFNSLADISNISVSGELVFENELVTKTMDGKNYIYGLNTTEFFERLHSNQNVQHNLESLDNFRKTAERIEDNYKAPQYYLSHFEERQTIAGYIRKIIPLSLLLDDGPIDIIAVLSGIEKLHLTFYRWDDYQQIFILQNQDILWYSEGQTIVDIFGLSYQGSDILVTETLDHTKYMQNLIVCSAKGLQKILQLNSNSSRKFASLELNGTACFIVYSKYNPHILTYCLEPLNGELTLVRKNELQITFAKQIIALEKEYLLALLPESVEIWRPDKAEAPCQIISIHNALHLAAASFGGITYLAVCTKGSVNSLHFGSVEIYRSLNYSQFKHLQSIEVTVPMQAEFGILKESSDLLLYILTNSQTQPLLVYEYQGVNGFHQKVRESAIPMGKAINVVSLKSNKRHLVSVISNSGAIFIESVLEKI